MTVDYPTSPFLPLFTFYLLNCAYKDFTIAAEEYCFKQQKWKKIALLVIRHGEGKDILEEGWSKGTNF